MFRNYLTIAWRQLSKNKLFGLINIFGLAIGITISLLLFLYTKKEVSFDKYHSNEKNIYRLVFNPTFDSKTEHWAGCPNIAGPAFKAAIGEITAQSRWIKHEFGRSANVLYNDKIFFEQNLYWADSSLTRIFDIPFIAGNPAKALTRPNTIIISETIARKYFGREDPIGKTLKIDTDLYCEITGVYKDLPRNSTLDADLIGSFYTVKWMNTRLVWSNASFETWLLLRPGADTARVNATMTAVVNKEMPKEDQWFSFHLQALKDVHLYSPDIRTYSSRTGDLKQVKIVGILALVILLIACINYMNLSTARSQKRFREVGISKTIGATSGVLIRRFYTETAVFVVLSVIAGILLLLAALPGFNALTNEQFSINDLFHADVWIVLLIATSLVTVIAGSYPALYLSSFNPSQLFHQTFIRKSMAGKLRQALVVVQFTASIILIICTFVFYRQLQFIQNKKLGFQPEQVVAITTTAAEKIEQIDGLIADTKNLASVKAVCRAQTYPGRNGSVRGIQKMDGKDAGIPLVTCRATASIIDVLNIPLLAGTGLPAIKAPGDTTVQVILNKKAVEYLGYTPAEAIGKRVDAQFGPDVYITGVMDDFHSESLHKPVGAYAFHNASTEGRNFMLIKLGTQQLRSSMQQIETIFRKHIPNGAFEFSFLDQYLQTLYAGEQRTAYIVLVFSGLAILIACLGLFGLAAFIAEQKTKEIGIRKVLGASVLNITGLLSGNFFKLVVIAIVLAIPVAWWMMDQWLQDFAYRTTISWWIFALAGAMAILIALITISFQSIKAAVANPVKSLRTE